MFDRREVRFNRKVQRRYGVELFHNIAGELKTYMAPTEQGADIVEEIKNVYDAGKERLQVFLGHKGISVEWNELGSAVQDIFNLIFHGLSKGIYDVDIQLTIHKPRLNIKNLAENRICCEGGENQFDILKEDAYNGIRAT